MALGCSGVRVGHWTDSGAQTGCTVVEMPPGTVASYEARGGAPASRELANLEPDKAVSAIDAVCLTGGSAFGLASADGVVRYLEQQGRGTPTPAGPVPIVPTLALYDLHVGDGTVRPTTESGYAAACDLAAERVAVRGRIGAGSGAYVGHWRGDSGREPGGLGYHEVRRDRLVVAALCAVNAFGDIHHVADPDDMSALDAWPSDEPAMMHTTIGVVVTNAPLSKIDCKIVAQGAHDGVARALNPPHTRFDGDAFIAAATGCGDDRFDIDVVRLLALTAVSTAIRSVRPSGATLPTGRSRR